MRFGRRRSFALAGVALAATVPALLGATSGTASRDTTVSCGETLTASVTLIADLPCGGSSGLVAGKNGIVINLNGHFISGNSSAPSGVDAAGFSNVTIENGTVLGFAIGVSGSGDGVHVERLKIVDTAGDGISLTGGTGDIVTGNYVEGSGVDGIHLAGAPTRPVVTTNYVTDSTANGIQLNQPTSATVSTNTAVSNGSEGISLGAATGTVTGNVANGNTVDGIAASGVATTPETLTVSANRASFNGGFGIAANVERDGGRNTVQGNGTAAQCQGIVCTEVSPTS